MKPKPIDHARQVPNPALRAADDLQRRGLSSLFSVDVDHHDGCQLTQGKPCNCLPKVSLVEKIPGVASLTEAQQQQLARFAAAGGQQFSVERDGDSLLIQSDETRAQQAIAGAIGAAVETITQAMTEQTAALAAITAAAEQQTVVLQGLALAVRQQTETIAASMEKPEAFSFERDQKGNITSAQKKTL